MIRRKSKIAAASLLLLLTVVVAIAAIKFEPVAGVNTGLPAKDMAWQKHTGSSEEEHTFLVGFFEGGIHLFATFTTVKYSMYQKWFFYGFLQDDNTDKRTFVKGECQEHPSPGSLTSFDFTCGATSFTGKWPDYTLKIRDPELNADIKFHALVPPFTPGKVLFSPDGATYTKCTIFNARAKTEGTLTYGGKTIKVRGEGYADHTYQNTSLTRQGPVFYAVRAFPDSKTPPDDQMYVNFSFQEIHKSYGGGYDAFMFAVRGNKVIGVTRKLKIEPTEQVTDPDSGYKYVKRVSLKSNDPELGFSGTFTVTKTIEVMDIFKWLPSPVRMVAAKLFKRPVYFRFLGNLEGQLKTKDKMYPVRQRATSEMNFTQ